MAYKHDIARFQAQDSEDVSLWLMRWTILKTTNIGKTSKLLTTLC